MICKSHSFTSLTQEECVLLARIIRGDKLNVGEMIFEQMKKFVGHRWQSGDIPFPQIVSFILKKFNIAHLQGEVKKKIAPFDSIPFNRMHIGLPYDHHRGMLPPTAQDKGKKKVGTPEAPEAGPTTSQQPRDEDHSSAGPVSTHAPSFFESSMRTVFMGEFEKMANLMRTQDDAMMGRLKTIMDNQTQLCKNQHDLLENQKSLDRSWVRMAEKQAQLRMGLAEIQAEMAKDRAAQKLRMDAMRHEVDDIKNLILHYINLGPTFSEADLGTSSEPPVHDPAPEPVPAPEPETLPPSSEPIPASSIDPQPEPNPETSTEPAPEPTLPESSSTPPPKN